MSGDRQPRALKNTYSAPALEKGFDVFELLADHPDGLTLSEIASGLGRSISELFRLIVVMERRGYLGKEPESDRYRVTYRVLDLAHRATPVQDLTHVATPAMYDLAHAVGQSCHLVVPAEGQGLVVLRQENPGPTGFGVRRGAAIDLFSSCSGNLLLALTDAERRFALLGPRAEEAEAVLPKLEPTLAAIRARGFERRPSAMTYGVIDISYPVFGFDGRLAAALTIPFLERIDGSQPVAIDASQEHLAAAARTISAGLGWYGRGDG